MMEKNGYAVKELIILSAILAVVFGIAITRISFAYEEIMDEENVEIERNHYLTVAAEYYAKMHEEEMQEEENFIFGSDLIDAGFLNDTGDKEKENAKIKITKENGSFHAEVVE